jgi:hypothetical protein
VLSDFSFQLRIIQSIGIPSTGNGDWADMLAEMDHNVGQTLDAVDRLGVRDNTIEPFCLRPKKSGGDWVEFSKINACPTPRNQTSINSELSYSGSARSFGDASSSEAIQRSLIYTKPCKSPLDGPTTTFTCPYQKFYPPFKYLHLVRLCTKVRSEKDNAPIRYKMGLTESPSCTEVNDVPFTRDCIRSGALSKCVYQPDVGQSPSADYRQLKARGRRTVTAALRQMGRGEDADFGFYHQVLNRARWSALELSRLLLLALIKAFVAASGPVHTENYIR